MGREMKRREVKKNKKLVSNKKDINFDTSINWVNAIKLIFAIVLILLVLYYILAVFVTKELDISGGSVNENSTTENNTTITNKILAANIFEQQESSYYVYFYDFSSGEDDLSGLISNGIDDKLYKVDTSSGLNSKYVVSDNGNKDASSIDELSVISNTLIKVEDDKITEYYEGKSNIMNALN